MAILDAERTAFADRMARYRAERDALRARGGSEQEVDRLRAAIFPPQERERVRKLEAIAALGAGPGS